MKMCTPSRSMVVGICGLFLATFGIWQIGSTVLAEQSGSSPESGATSRIKTAYDWLVDKGVNYGETDASDWSNNWGSMWNRIMESATWEPDGTATEADVASTKTFYSGSGDRTIKTGTAPAAFDYSTQKLATKDDYLGTYKAEESTWTAVSGSPFGGYGDLNLTTGKVKQDSLTGLWWSASSIESPTNIFTLSSDGVRPIGGNAIAFCNALNTANYGGHADWYLPSQKELLQAYIDGIYSQDSDSDNGRYYWSSSQSSTNSLYAWYVRLSVGDTGLEPKDDGQGYMYARCVRRD